MSSRFLLQLCMFQIDYSVFERNRLTEYCRRCGIAVSNEISTNEIVKMFMQAISISLSLHHNYENIFTKSPESKMERLDSILFCKSLHIEMKNTDDLRKAVSLVLQEEYSDYIKQLKETFRIACFTTKQRVKRLSATVHVPALWTISH